MAHDHLVEPVEPVEPVERVAPRAPRPRVALIFGGTSSEHAVSCLTAGSVARAIDPDRFEVVGIGITREGRWVRVGDEQLRALSVEVDDSGATSLPAVPADAANALLMRGSTGTELVTRAAAPASGLSAISDVGGIDVAFALLHGPYGEDGTIQGLFEMTGVPYVGAGVLASAVGMDKHFMKLVLSASGIPIGPFVTITPRAWAADPVTALDAVAALGFPVYVKPARGGSSMGITRVDDRDGVEAAIAEAQRFDPKILVEKGFVGARELECGVLDGPDGPQASVVAEIRMHTRSGFYDFEAKYLPEEQVELDVPADLDADLEQRVRDLAVKTFVALDGEGLARVDFFCCGDGRLVVNEINTMPGFTQHSMFPRMWAESGVDYPELIERLITLALGRSTGLR
jgi:D-alanine-D-alanine ligase